jgi:hypothetical protein
VRVITIVGGDLFHIASTELGDALQWINIARANNIMDPVITGQIQLIIPAFSQAFSDGIGPQ